MAYWPLLMNTIKIHFPKQTNIIDVSVPFHKLFAGSDKGNYSINVEILDL